MHSAVRFVSVLVPLLLAAALAGVSRPSIGQEADAADATASPGAVAAQFGARSQAGVRAHQAQIRSRQARVRDRRAPPLPRFANGLTMSNDKATVPLRLKDAPAPGRPRLAPGTIGRHNGFVRGDIASDPGDSSGSGLSTADLTLGSDYRFSEDAMVGVAAGRLSTREAVGTTLSAYLTVQPVERLFVDLSLSVGAHRARFGPARLPAVAGSAIEGVSRGFSLALNHPRQVGQWTWSPYGRVDHVTTEAETQTGAAAPIAVTRELSAWSVGSVVETIWATPFGEMRPVVLVELQRELTGPDGGGSTAGQTHGVLGFGMTTKVSREMSAFAESRYAQAGGTDLDRQVMLGVKLAF